ncbi:MAG: methionine--tRNA ligase [Bacteroidetes bacterium]|nr:methionine--tRNA ligase [Bacteroidota bacterium]
MKNNENPKRYLVTAALPYANGPLHIGHIAGCYLPADIYVRFLRLAGKDVKFICGSDEHGMAITMRAKKEDTTPKAIVDKYDKLMKDAFAEFGITFDIYSRTSNALHHKTAQEFFLHLYNKGVFTEKETEQYYDEKAKQFLADRYIKGTCPKCGYNEAYGDQCEKCGSSLNPTDLINPISTLTGNSPTLRKTKNWYLPLGEYQRSLGDYIKSKKDSWKANVYGQCISWLNDGLQERAMTRDLDWGVKVPLKEAEGKVLYVWFDAPIGYISATKELLPNDWDVYWKSEDTVLIHFIGKDNIVFHCLIFPAMLMAHEQYILPTNVPANEFLNLEGRKISTSKNWAVWLHEYLEDFPNKQDELRYVLTSIAPETSDSEFTWKDFQSKVNNELVAILGNFINRVTTLINKYYEGYVPEINRKDNPELIDEISRAYQKSREFTLNYNFRQGLSSIMDLARFGNRFITAQEPWKRIKTEPESVKQILVDCLIISAHLGKLLIPYLPHSSDRIFSMLNLNPEDINERESIIPFGKQHKILEPSLLFEKIEDAEIEKQRLKLMNSSEKESNSGSINTIIPEVSFNDFEKMDLRTAVITAAEKVPKTDKLLKLSIDLGYEQRTIVSGIAEHYTPEEAIGQTVLIIANLAPRTIKGIESKGMILMAEENGKLSFMTTHKPFKGGAVVK